MFWFAAVMIAFTSNLDNLGVGLSFGMRSMRISMAPNSIIALITMLGTGLAMLLGSTIAHLVPLAIINFLGGFVIIGIGASTLFGARHTLRQNIATVPVQDAKVSGRTLSSFSRPGIGSSSTISNREAVIVGIALSCNNVATGVAAGASGISAITTTILAGVFSFVFVGGGSRLGSAAGVRLLGRFAPLLAGIILVAIGIAVTVE